MSDTPITPEARAAALNEVANAHKRLPCLQHPTGYFVAEAITRATADAQERIAELERERDSAVLSTHRQAMCINDCAAHIGPETSATIEGLPKAVKHLAAERDSLRAELEKAKRNRCDHCGAKVTGPCPICGAPQCCPQCCRIDELGRELEKVKRERDRKAEAALNHSNDTTLLHARIATLERELAEARERIPKTNREAHEEAAGMGLDGSFFAVNGIDPNAPYDSEKDGLRCQITSLQQQVTTLQHELAGARRQTEMDTVRFAEMQQSGAELEVANDSLRQQVAALSERNSKLQAILKEAARELENASAQAKNVEWCQHYDGWARECTKLLACDRPPEGWVCTRGYGHLGPCAALTTQEPREKGGAA